ncbi:MAG: methyltransferase domain-containing protein [Proteobacteria bacterium]|nr:methyltransferase domain-containing protein [Pseudomonadota bacterium]
MTLFDSHTYALHYKRAQKTFREHAFLFDHVGSELVGRMEDVKKNFKEGLNLSPYSLTPLKRLQICHPREGGDPEKALVGECKESFQDVKNVLDPRFRGDDIKEDRDDIKDKVEAFAIHNHLHPETLPFPDESFDFVVSCLSAHWINDFPRFLLSVRRCLQPGGIFLGALWGGNTLVELRESLLRAEMSLKGGASPRVAPMLQPSDAPLLLGRAGFKNPVVDTETLTVTYASLWSLMKDLRGMGETNKMHDRVKTFTPSRLFKKAEEIYQDSFGRPDGKLTATFEVIYLTGWSDLD